jgi:allantoinase
MSDYDLLVRSRLPDGSAIALGIADGCFQAVGPDLSGTGSEELDHRHGFIIPGWIDAHVHFNEPGRTDWEGLETGSRAHAAGGGTVFFDMPLNSSPPVLTAAALQEKRALAEHKACTDFALWGGLTPDSLDHLGAMAAAGAIGFKAFMCPSGLDEFRHADAATLKTGMTRAAALGLPVAVHAELDPASRPEACDMAAWLASRPIQLELDAIQLALDLAGETGCALHIVHVSCAEGIDLVSTAKACGVNVTVETCPHYLLLSDAEAIRIGAFAKCAPPLRSPETVAGLRERLLAGAIDTLGSDHSPASPDLKQGSDFFTLWGGIAGIQHALPLLLDAALAPLDTLSAQVAQRFRLPRKGGFQIGHDADFALLSLSPRIVAPTESLTRHPISPYFHHPIRHRVDATYLRGRQITHETCGRFLRPSPIPS